MAVKTFVTGTVLTAADTNEYLANSGLVYVTSTVIPASPASSTVVVSNAFNATYDAYKVVWTGGNGSAANEIGVRLGSANSNYYGFLTYGVYNSITNYGVNDSNQALFRYVGGADSAYGSLDFDIINPYLAKPTIINASGNYGASAFGFYSGRLNDTSSYTAFTLIPGTGTLSNGVITVYGYRKA
jgi:hypothetical protein